MSDYGTPAFQKIFSRSTHESEALLSLGESRVGSEQDALVKVSHRLVHLVQQDLQLRGNVDFTESTTAHIYQDITNNPQLTADQLNKQTPTCPLW